MLTISKKDGSIIFNIKGNITLETEGSLKNKILDTLQNEKSYNIVYIEMSEVKFIDSSGIGMLIYIYNFLESNKAILKIGKRKYVIFFAFTIPLFFVYIRRVHQDPL